MHPGLIAAGSLIDGIEKADIVDFSRGLVGELEFD